MSRISGGRSSITTPPREAEKELGVTGHVHDVGVPEDGPVPGAIGRVLPVDGILVAKALEGRVRRSRDVPLGCVDVEIVVGG